ncbi:hypothetical protein PF002_g25602, partial [Phytophthora fragariae]
EVHTGLGIKKRGRGTLLAAVSKIIVLSGPSSAQLSTSPLAKESDTVASASAAVSDAAADPADSVKIDLHRRSGGRQGVGDHRRHGDGARRGADVGGAQHRLAHEAKEGIVGIVTERDILKKMSPRTVLSEEKFVHDVMSSPIMCIHPTTTVIEYVDAS